MTSAAAVIDGIACDLLGAPLPLSIRCWDGSRLVRPGSAATLVVRSPRALRSLLWAPGELGLARAYVRGDLDLEGDLESLLAFPDTLAERPTLTYGRAQLQRLVKGALSVGAVGLPPRPPPEEARISGSRHSLLRDRDAVSHHYDVGNEFYRLLLGPSLVYSCAYFSAPGQDLADAQRAKLDLVCRKLGLRPGMRLLDVGCGWGSLVLHAVREHGVRAVGVTVSAEQAALARDRVAEAGLSDEVEIRLQDYREVLDGPYDAIASVGMAEHVGSAELPAYANGLYALLAPSGRLLHHAIARGPAPGPQRPDARSFLTRYVFPDGELQSLTTHVGVLEQAGFEVRDVEALREHYALTCRAWVTNLEADWERAQRLGGAGRARVWRLYLAGAARSFEQLRVGVNQLLCVKPPGTGLPLRSRTWTS